MKTLFLTLVLLCLLLTRVGAQTECSHVPGYNTYWLNTRAIPVKIIGVSGPTNELIIGRADDKYESLLFTFHFDDKTVFMEVKGGSIKKGKSIHQVNRKFFDENREKKRWLVRFCSECHLVLMLQNVN